MLTSLVRLPPLTCPVIPWHSTRQLPDMLHQRRPAAPVGLHTNTLELCGHQWTRCNDWHTRSSQSSSPAPSSGYAALARLRQLAGAEQRSAVLVAMLRVEGMAAACRLAAYLIKSN
jgi:hypothetical protein